MAWKEYQAYCILGRLYDRRTDRSEHKLAVLKARTDNEALKRAMAIMHRRFLTGFCRVEALPA